MKKVRKWIVPFLCLTVLFVTAGSAGSPLLAREADPVSIYVNGQRLETDVAPVNANGRIFVPVYPLMQALDATAEWDPSRESVTIRKGDTVLRLAAGQRIAYRNQQAVTMESEPFVSGGRLFVPLRSISEAFDLNVQWYANTRTILISEHQAQLPAVGTRDHLKNLLSRAVEEYDLNPVRLMNDAMAVEEMALEQADTAEKAASSAPAADDFSGTNVQVADVDEADPGQDGRNLHLSGSGPTHPDHAGASGRPDGSGPND